MDPKIDIVVMVNGEEFFGFYNDDMVSFTTDYQGNTKVIERLGAALNLLNEAYTSSKVSAQD